MILSDEQRALVGDMAVAVQSAAERLPRERLLVAADHFVDALKLLGVERAAILDAHARGPAVLERLVCDVLAAADEVRLSGAFIRMRRAWVLLGVDPSVVERWDAQVDAAHRAHRVLLRAASLLPDVSRPLRVEDYLSPVAAEPRKRARRKGRGLR